MWFSALLSLFAVVFTIAWMWQMLKLTRQSRIINSMTLKVLQQYCKAKGVDIDIEMIQQEVEENLDAK